MEQIVDFISNIDEVSVLLWALIVNILIFIVSQCITIYLKICSISRENKIEYTAYVSREILVKDIPESIDEFMKSNTDVEVKSAGFVLRRTLKSLMTRSLVFKYTDNKKYMALRKCVFKLEETISSTNKTGISRKKEIVSDVIGDIYKHYFSL